MPKDKYQLEINRYGKKLTTKERKRFKEALRKGNVIYLSKEANGVFLDDGSFTRILENIFPKTHKVLFLN